MSREKALNLLGHYVGNWTLAAYDESDKDKQREELILKLSGLEQIDEVKKTLEILQGRTWTANADIDGFKERYKQICPDEELHATIDKLFGSKK